MVNWEFFDNMTPGSARALVDDLRSGAAVPPGRRPRRLCSWREASRILAGFPDGQAGDGPQAAGPSLAGLRLARARGWTAPPGPASAGAATTGPAAAGEDGQR
jgi:NADH-quinone oxidoreductase subunit E